jgi:hypothetical protein
MMDFSINNTEDMLKLIMFIKAYEEIDNEQKAHEKKVDDVYNQVIKNHFPDKNDFYDLTESEYFELETEFNTATYKAGFTDKKGVIILEYNHLHDKIITAESIKRWLIRLTGTYTSKLKLTDVYKLVKLQKYLLEKYYD